VTAERTLEIVGRDIEVAQLHEFIGADQRRATLVLSGGPGIGKTTIWQDGIEAAREQGLRVLASRPSGAEAHHSFSVLIDLCDELEFDAFADIPGPQRSALEVALLRAEPSDKPLEPHAIALGFLGLLRAISRESRVLIAVDDLQWLDSPSAEVLAFVARRLEGEPVGFLLAKRPGPASALERALERGYLRQLDMGPLSFGATRRLLSERLGLNLSRELLRRVVELTLGNPLFALELGRAFRQHGVPQGAEDMPLPGGIEELLGMRLVALQPEIRRLLVAVALSADIRTSELVAVGGIATLEAAVDSGMLVVAGDRVRPSHPLVAAAAKSIAPRGEQRELHRALASLATDGELRAMHLALATEHADGELARTVAEAASSAFARGARQQAVALAEHALRLTERGSTERPQRVLTLARYLEIAGELKRLTEMLTPELQSLPTGEQRAQAWLMLSEGTGPRHVEDLRRYRERALAENGGDPRLRATVLAKNAANASGSAVSDLAGANAAALEACAAAEGGGAELEHFARYGLAWARAMTGRPVDDLCESSAAASERAAYIAGSPERVAAQRLVWRGEISRARPQLMRFLALADERGERESYALQRLHVCELHLRVGDWGAASALLDEWSESSDRELMFRPKYERCCALLEAGRGAPESAERWARRTITLADESGCRWDGLEGLRALGIAQLLAREPAAASTSFRTVWEHTQREGVEEPGVFPVAPELVEALVELEELDEARGVTLRLRALSERQEHPWGLASARRCAALVDLAAERYDEQAAVELDEAAAVYGQLGLRFDAARSQLSLGRAQRRFKKWGVARRSLEQAAAAFDELGSPGWAEQAHAELSRLGARRPVADGDLTASEQRAAELAAGGMSNKQIARELFVTVHTVEVHLSRAYAKLGVSSRGQLAARLAPID
jgi:DNA-binding CsgD family transcriptional regulator